MPLSPENARLAYLKRSVAGNAAGLLELLKEARDRVYGTIARRAGVDVAVTSKKEMDALAAEVGGHYGKLSGDLATYWQEIYKKQGKAWRKFAWEDAGLPFTETDLQKFSLSYAKEAWTYNLRPFIAAHVQKMEDTEKAQLRDAVQKGLQFGRLTGATAREVEKDIKARFFGLAGGENPNWRFIDRAGRGWTARNYFNMVSRTTTANIARTAYMDGLAADGFDVVRVSAAGDPCDVCKAWAGRLLSQSGQTKGLPTYQQAVAAGVFHPNCVCHLEFVSPVLNAKEIEEATGNPYTPPTPQPPKVVSTKETGIEPTPGQKALAALPAVNAQGAASAAGRFVKHTAEAATPAQVGALAKLAPTPDELANALDEAVPVGAIRLRSPGAVVNATVADSLLAGTAQAAKLRLLALEDGFVLADETEPQLAALLAARLGGTAEVTASVARIVRGFPELGAVEKGLEEVQSLGGTTGAKLVKDARGQLYVMKRGASADHIREEHLTDEAYRALGVPVPEGRLYETKGGPVKLAKYIADGDTVGALKGATRAAAEVAAREHFAADALLGNWDVTGQADDNLLRDKAGTVWRIDNGGGLRFRAQGARKTADEWGEHPTDFWTMRRAGVAAERIMGKADFFELVRQVEAITPAQVTALKEALPADVFATVEKRLEHLRDIAASSLDAQHFAWRADTWDEVAGHMIGLRKSGFTGALPKSLTVTGHSEIVDERGIKWGGFRSLSLPGRSAAPVAPAHPDDPYYPTILAAAKTVNHHILAGDFAPNAAKVDALKALLPTIKKAAAAGEGWAVDHLPTAKQILAAAEDLAAKKTPAIISNVTAYSSPTPTAAPQVKAADVLAETHTDRLAAYFKAQGLNMDAPLQWADDHAGSSASGTAQAVKHWIAQGLDLPRSAHSWHNTGGDEHGAEAAFKAAAQRFGGADKLRSSYAAWHAAQQEVLGRVAMENNDTARRAFRIMRTERASDLNDYKVKLGDGRNMPRGVNESGSMFSEVIISANQLTEQAVPHSRITGLYLFERTNSPVTVFAGDSENEATFAGARIPFKLSGKAVSHKEHLEGKDATAWGLDISHLRKGTP